MLVAAVMKTSRAASISSTEKAFSSILRPSGLATSIRVVRVTPLYQGVALLRGLTTGDVGPELIVPVVYLVTMGLVGLSIASRRLERLLLR